jgi:hypothetical protein
MASYKKTKGRSYQKYVQTLFTIPVKVVAAVQRQETGETMALVRQKKDYQPKWYVVWLSSVEAAEWGTDEAGARKQFNDYRSMI